MGAFDDLIPEKKRGAFDDLIPKIEMSAAERGTRRFRHTMGFGVGLLDAPLDAISAAGNVAMGANPDLSLPQEYARQRARTRAALQNDELNAPDVAADTAGNVVGGIAMAPLTVSRAVGEAGIGAYEAGKNALLRQLMLKEEGARVGAELTKKEAAKQIGRESARVGGAIGVAGGYSNTPDNADLGDTLLNMGEEGFGGAAIGRALPPIIDKTGQAIHWAKNKLTRPSAAAGERARAAAADVEATGGQEFAPELGGPMVGATASGLSGTVLGGPVRQGARMSLDTLEARIQQEIQAAGGAGTPEQVGQRAQEFIRHNVTERSRTPEEVNAMGPLELHGISGVPPGPGQEIPPPRVPPTLPREIPPVRPADVVDEMVANTPPVPPKPVTDLESRYKPPTKEEVELAPEMVDKVQKAGADVADLQRRLEAETGHLTDQTKALVAELDKHGYGDVRPVGRTLHVLDKNGLIAFRVREDGHILPGNHIATPEDTELARRLADWYVTHGPEIKGSVAKTQKALEAAQREHDIVQREMEAFRVQELPKLAEQRRQEALADATKANEAEASVATQKAREGARAKASAEANQIAMQRTQQARDFEAERAARATEARQHEANQAHEVQLQAARADLGEPVQPLGRSREHTYPTEIDAAYAANRGNMPDMRRNVLGRRENQNRPAENTNTSDLLNTFGLEARRRDQMFGYRPGDQFTPRGDINPDLLPYLRQHLGDEIADRLAALGQRRANSQFAPGVQGLQDLRTLIDRQIAKVRRPPPAGMGQHREDYGMLSRLRQSVDRDIEEFSHGSGREGEIYRRQREQIDQQKRQLEQEIQPALKSVFGEKVEPQEALRNLIEATQNGTNNFSTLRNFYRVVNDKGDRLRATSWLLNDMTRDGIPGFLKAYRNISPDARALMQEAAPDMMRFLDAAARRGGRLERFTKTASDDYGNDLSKYLRPGNMAIGSLAYMFSWPGAISMTLGGGALSKVMASKWFAGWLKSYPITRSPTDPRIAQHLNRLYALSSESLGLDKESAQQLKDALLPGKANALFVGEQGAKPSDKITLEQAQQMQKKNEDPGKIWAETGWTQGDEGKWKFELDDHDAALTEKSMAALDTAREGKGVVEVPLGQVLDHPHLFDYYPEAENIKVVFGTTKTYPEGIRANDWWASQSGNRIAVNANHEDFNENELTLSILHEVQHWLAVKNKFRYGGGKKVPYEDIPGERQSQEVEERKDLSYEERRAKRPTMQLGGPSPEGNKQEVGPTPEERGFLAPLVKPRGSSEFELGVPGIVKWPYDAAKRLMSDEGQYRPGTQDEAGVRDAMTAASATGAGALATRPASSLGTFAGRTAFQPRVSGKFSGIGAAPEVKASVLEQYKNGVPVRRIALDHGLTQYDVRKLAVKHGVGRDVRAPRAPDFWNEGRIAEAVDLRNRGKTHDQIAQHFGMKAENIASMFSRRGLSKKQPAPEVGRNRPSETPLDREAMSVEQEARSIEAAAGSPDEAAKAINERFGGNTTADDIKKGNVWWKVDEPRELSGMPSHDAWDTSRIYAAGAPTQGPDAGDRGVHKVVFTGESSKTADKEALAKAKDMDGQADPSKIWQRTGWYKSKDGEWNNEIDDSQAKFKIDPSLVAGRKPTDYLETTLGKVIDHPGLFAAHPHLSSMPIRLYNANELPDEGGGASTMLPSKSNPRGYIELPIGSTDPDDMGILLHEINHALEPENNFDYGPFEGKYKNRQGEVKARNVQTRQEMTAEQRRKSYPPSTEDIKWPRVLVRSKEQRRLSETADDEDNIHAAHLP